MASGLLLNMSSKEIGKPFTLTGNELAKYHKLFGIGSSPRTICVFEEKSDQFHLSNVNHKAMQLFAKLNKYQHFLFFGNVFLEGINSIQDWDVFCDNVNANDPKVSANDPKVSANDPKVSANDPKVSENDLKVSENDLKVSENDLKVSANDLKMGENFDNGYDDDDDENECDELIKGTESQSVDQSEPESDYDDYTFDEDEGEDDTHDVSDDEVDLDGQEEESEIHHES